MMILPNWKKDFKPQPIFWNGKKYIFYSNTENTIKNLCEIREKYKNDCIFGDPSIHGSRRDKFDYWIQIQFAKSISEAREKYNLIGIYLSEEYLGD